MWRESRIESVEGRVREREQLRRNVEKILRSDVAVLKPLV